MFGSGLWPSCLIKYKKVLVALDPGPGWILGPGKWDRRFFPISDGIFKRHGRDSAPQNRPFVHRGSIVEPSDLQNERFFREAIFSLI